jgi:hypothetical protein
MLISKKLNMKRNIYLLFMVIGLVLFTGPGCDPDKITELDNPKYLLVPSNSDMSMMFTNIITTAGRRTTGRNAVEVPGGYVKYYATFSFLLETGGLYNYNQGRNDNQWGPYSNELNMAITLEHFLVNLNDPLHVNNLARTRIMKVLILQRLTDMYGDIPASEAGLAFIDNIIKPKYDRQQDIYKYMLETLDQAIGSLDSGPALAPRTWKGGRDLAYGGNIDKWRRFGNSLMLRIAMRASAADAAMAKTYAEKAIAGGVITSNADNWKLPTRDGLNSEKNEYSSFFMGSPSGDPERYIKLGEFFVNFLKDKADPRRKVIFGPRLLPTITAVTAQNMATYWRDETRWDFNLDEATGMIHGTQTNPMGLAEYHHTFTSPNPWLWVLNLPHEVITAGEVQYLVAEASLNGWSTGTTAEAAYTAAVNASMNMYGNYPGLLEFMRISQAETDDYLAANPLGTGQDARVRLAEEMYVHMYMDPYESWLNLVRNKAFTVPTNVPGKEMPRRHAYVNNERSNNFDNMVEALQRLGLNEGNPPETEWYSRVWWDKP